MAAKKPSSAIDMAELDPVLHGVGFEMQEVSPSLLSGRLPVTERCCQPFKRCCTAACRRWWRRALPAWARTWRPAIAASPACTSPSTTSAAPRSATSSSRAPSPSTSDAPPRCGR
uniref:Uncharacterized protein n=1 Tax=Aegilops tauschii subsp. strangulata TaxID=200361 RepID=A0A453DYQ5_AEGTS